MPDTKITALTALTAADPANDVLPIVDVSDTTMAASGTTKKISINNVLGCSGTATLASATITGNLTAAAVIPSGSTVPTNGLYLPTANNLGFAYNSTLGMTLNSTGLGVGVSPAYKLDVAGSSAGVLRLVNINNSSTDPAAVTRLSLDSQGATWHLDNERTSGIFKITRNSTACLTIDNSANVGIGVTSPATKLDVAGNARVQLAFFTGGSIPGLTNENPFAYRIPGGGLGLGAATETGTVSPIIFYTGAGGVERVRVKGFGQVRFFPLAADPSLAEAGDVYYNSTSNKLKCYNGTTWNDLF